MIDGSVNPEVSQEQPDMNQEQDKPAPQQPNSIPDEFKEFFKDLLHKCEIEDSGVHNALVRKARRLQFYFNNIVDLFWNEQTGDFEIPNWDELENGGVPPRIVNIYRPHAESIIAALSVKVPGVVFFPNDADNADDIDTAQAYSNLAKIVQKHNKAKLAVIKIITILFNEGTCFAYSYPKQDRAFGYYDKVIQDMVETPYTDHYCYDCGYNFGPGPKESQDAQCPECGNRNNTETVDKSVQIPVENSVRETKTRTLIDLFGPINVKVPYSARIQDHVGYLILRFDQSVALLRSIYCVPGPNGEPPYLEDINPKTSDSTTDSWVRYPSIYIGTQPENTAIVKCVWFRNWQFDLLRKSDDTLVDNIKKAFPKGCYVIFINDEPVEAVDENLDEHWTISYDPRSQALHGEPIGTNLALIQDIQAEISELELQTMEHGISEVFVASDVLDLDKYQDTESRPGQITPVKKEVGKAISENFYETKTATFSPEIAALNGKYENLAEFVTGDFPTVSGAPTGGSGATATEYSKSQSQALQRLGTIYEIFSNFWTEIVRKSTIIQASQMDYNENLVERGASGFSNIQVNHEQLGSGNVGRAEPESSDGLPLSWAQIKDVLVQLLTLKDPMVMSMLSHPKNNELIKKAIGIPELFIPGEGDRNKQEREITLLLQQQPIMPDLNNMPPEVVMNPQMMQPKSSIPVEPFDDHAVEAEICQEFLVSSKGQKEKLMNPGGYQNVVLHWQEHDLQAKLKMQQTAPPQDNVGDTEKPKQPQVGA